MTMPIHNLTIPRRIKKLLLIALAILGAQLISAQEVYDLRKCIATGLEQNFSIQVSRNREAIAANNFTRGNAGFLPDLNLNSRVGGTVSDTRQILNDGSENLSNGVHNLSANTGVTLNWTIFNGYLVQTTYQKLHEMKQIGELNTQIAIENLVAKIASEYFFYVQQLRLYNNLRYAVALSRERVRIDEQRYLLGSSSKLQLLQSVVYLNADSSRYAKQNEVLRASQIRLNELMTVSELGADISLADTSIHIISTLELDQLLSEMLAGNTALLLASKNRVVSQYDYKIIASRAYPYLGFTSGYNMAHNRYEAGNVDRQRTLTANYGLTLSMNIFDGYNRKREISNAQVEIENRDYLYKEVEQQIKADLLTIFYGYQNNLNLLKLEEQNLAAASENLEIALERYKLGNLSGLELREVQKSYLDAEERLISVQYQTKLAEISLFQISGGIMNYLE